ncbi:toprim domain-containing protein [Mucilaginibacter pedocola]|uniref:Zinc finger CHC2-type domain-containing protein n=1 Tax=Mucilaginibacter pedocola TaxID=1792845 RepID=A0A1S9PMN9_9SPHI|nr:toprim domain-containing protein [Mucilaginibacter pedocola]OOQ62191.1 hypothetical protein BC343_03870 [Mucilaginibacter pedocola]
MKIIEAKSIPLKHIVEYLKGRFHETDRKGDDWYFSPFRPEEKTASFKVNTKLNTWHDFGTCNSGVNSRHGSGGDGLDLWCDYHFNDRRSGIPDALEGLEALSQFAQRGEDYGTVRSKEKPTLQVPSATFKILKISDRITHYGLLDELQRRKISLELASLYLKQGHILNTVSNKQYYGFLFANDRGGYELSIPNPNKGTSFKTCIGTKAISYVPPAKEKHSADIFEGFFDFLSWLEIKKIKQPMHHSYILNSNSLAGEANGRLIEMKDRIGYVFLFLDNDESGCQTSHSIALALEPEGFQMAGMEGFYKGFKDLSAYIKQHFTI